MMLPRFKLLFGVILMAVAAFLPTVLLQDILVSTADTTVLGYDASGILVQFVVILFGSIGFSLIKGVVKDGVFRQKKKKSRYR